MINPSAILIVVILWIASVVGAFMYGRTVERDSIAAGQSAQKDRAQERETERQATVEAIGAATGAAVAVAMNQNTGATHTSVEKIREVYIPADCRNVDPVSLHELRAASAAANESLRNSLRSLAAGTAP